MSNFKENFIKHFDSSAPDLFNSINFHSVVKINSEDELFSELNRTKIKSDMADANVNNKRLKWCGLVAAAVIIIVCTIAIHPFNICKADVVGNIIIDCNPSFNLEITENLKVNSLYALNEDGAEIIKNIKLNKSVEDVISQVVEELRINGYLDLKSDDLLVSYCYKKDNTKFGEIKRIINKKIAEDEVDVIYQSFKEEKSLENKALESNVSVGKYKYIQKIRKKHKLKRNDFFEMNINEIKKATDEDFYVEADQKSEINVTEKMDVSDKKLNKENVEIKSTQKIKESEKVVSGTTSTLKPTKKIVVKNQKENIISMQSTQAESNEKININSGTNKNKEATSNTHGGFENKGKNHSENEKSEKPDAPTAPKNSEPHKKPDISEKEKNDKPDENKKQPDKGNRSNGEKQNNLPR